MLLDNRQYISQLKTMIEQSDVPWDEFSASKLWYSKIKSRPSFKDLLKDTIRGILPARNYTNLDF